MDNSLPYRTDVAQVLRLVDPLTAMSTGPGFKIPGCFPGAAWVIDQCFLYEHTEASDIDRAKTGHEKLGASDDLYG